MKARELLLTLLIEQIHCKLFRDYYGQKLRLTTIQRVHKYILDKLYWKFLWRVRPHWRCNIHEAHSYFGRMRGRYSDSREFHKPTI